MPVLDRQTAGERSARSEIEIRQSEMEIDCNGIVAALSGVEFDP
jgi:hypothetical protein